MIDFPDFTAYEKSIAARVCRNPGSRPFLAGSCINGSLETFLRKFVSPDYIGRIIKVFILKFYI